MIDIIIVFTYLATLLFIGVSQRSKQLGFKMFSKMSDSSNKGKLIMVATIFASTIGGGTTFGISEKAFLGNLSYSYGLFIALPVDILIAIFIIPKLAQQHYGAESMGDIMNVYYGNTGRYIAGASAILVSIGLIAAQISVSGRIFEYILHIDYISGVILSYGIVIIYTTIGGLQSVLFANQFQFFAILVAIPIISFFGLYQIGIENFFNLIPSKNFSLLDNSDLLKDSIFLALGFMVINLFPTFIQRALINKDSAITTNAIYIKSAIYAVFLLFITLNGLIAFVKYPNIESSLALPHLIDNMIPVGVQGLVIVGLLAAVMSTADSDLNITSVTLVKDFIKPIFLVRSEKRMLILARTINIIIGSLSIFVALHFTKVADLVIFISGFWGPVILVPFVFALFNIVISKKAFVYCCLSGMMGFILWESYFTQYSNFKGVFIGTMCNLIVFLFCSFYKKLIR